MLRLKLIDTKGQWDRKNERFVYAKPMELQLEHSLVSISKWESKYCKPFLSDNKKTDEELLDYIMFMTITQNVDPSVYLRLSEEHIQQISDYIDAPMTATTFSKTNDGKRNREIVTSEIIYYWMILHNIPSRYEKWHLNRLLTLIRVCNIKSSPPKKRSVREILNRNVALNEARKKVLNSKG